MTIKTFQRLYRDMDGPIYPADEKIAATVVRSMNEHAGGWDPFRVRFGLEDGSRVIVSPKKRSAA